MRPGSDTALLTPLHPPLLLTPFSPQPRTSFSQQQLHQHIRVILQKRLKIVHISEAAVLEIIDCMVFFWLFVYSLIWSRGGGSRNTRRNNRSSNSLNTKTRVSRVSTVALQTMRCLIVPSTNYSDKLNKLNTIKLAVIVSRAGVSLFSFFFFTVCSCLFLTHRCSGKLSGQAKAPRGDPQEAETGST